MKAVHSGLEDEIVGALREVLQSGRFIGGPKVEGFENEFAKFCETKLCVGVGSGTDALRFALMAIGIAQNDRVITVPNTFIATTEAITQCGATPVFIDINEKTYNLDVDKLREYLEKGCIRDNPTGKTFDIKTGWPVTAIVPVHLYGQMADMDPILDMAQTYHLTVIEDACQAHGAQYFSRKLNRWCKAGSMGKAGAFSFYPGKNLGALGEGGAVTTNDANLAAKIKMLRDHGQSQKYFHDIEGYNGRLDALQADILKIKLGRLDAWNNKRQEIAKRYNQYLTGVGDLIAPFTPDNSRPIHHLYVVRTNNRDLLRDYLISRGIETGLHYPLPLHLQNAYGKLGIKSNSLPVSEKLATEILSLPMYPSLSEDKQDKIIGCITEYFVNASQKEMVAS